MPRSALHINLDDDLVAAVDKIRGDVPRSRWISRAIEAALYAESAMQEPQGPGRRRAPVEQVDSDDRAAMRASVAADDGPEARPRRRATRGPSGPPPGKAGVEYGKLLKGGK